MEARRAHVRPRVLVDAGGGSRCLDAVWGEVLAGMPHFVAIVGERGSGKTTALLHAMSLPRPDLRIRWVDEGTVLGEKVRDPRITVYTAAEPEIMVKTCVLTLMPWGDDEIIEYVLSAAKERAPVVIPRALGSESRGDLEGSPGLWAPVLERMIADDSEGEPVAVLRTLVREQYRDEKTRRRAATIALAKVLDDSPLKAEPARGLIAQRPVQLMVAAGVLVEGLTHRPTRWALPNVLPEDLQNACVRELTVHPEAVRVLREFLYSGYEHRHSAAASLLHAAGGLERPTTVGVLNVTEARLPGLSWPGVVIEKLKASGADLSDADLSRAKIASAWLSGARMSRAMLAYAEIVGGDLRLAKLMGANLSFAKVGKADFSEAVLSAALLEGADAEQARFDRTVLTDARLVRANLRQTVIHRCDMDGADLSGANLDDATLQWLDLRGVELVGASFREAELSQCDMSGLHLPAAVFEGASFDQVDLTATSMPNATFAGAVLSECGLAEVDWEAADLRGADLRRSTFHAGSSRSGLVFSPIASEGSRTGFYTDEFDAHTHKAPEEVRKASLRGADLRGAVLTGVDFYLVDLRDAQYDQEAGDWFRKCGAILHHRV